MPVLLLLVLGFALSCGIAIVVLFLFGQSMFAQDITFNKNFEGASLGKIEPQSPTAFRCAVEGQYDQRGPTHGAHGCAMLVSREVIDKVGMFPLKFFIYYEEWDWSARILKAGYKIWYVGDALIYHKESVTMGKKSAIKVYYHTRNRILYMRRNTNPLQFSVFMAFFVFVAVPKSVFYFSYHRQFQHLKSFFKGVFWNLTTSSYSPV